MTISAKIVADSISPSGVRLTTMELTYHRFIHSEFMTHRMFSRNAASSRALPVNKMLEQVQRNPAMPIHWGKNQPGMQAREELNEHCKDNAIKHWHQACEDAKENVRWLESVGCHKQIVNRLLEPFQYIKVIVTATEWDNFFKLRNHPDAQPEIQELAACMLESMCHFEPTLLQPGEWHLPYVTWEDGLRLEGSNTLLSDLIKCSVARCARVSYNNHDNSTPDISKDIALADKLLEAGHMSPFEHQGTPMSCNLEGYITDGVTRAWQEIGGWDKGTTHMDINGSLWSGNFKGFLQYRQLIS